MAEEKKETETTASAPAAPASASGGGSKVILALTAVNLLLTVGVGAVLFMNFSKQGTKPALEDITTAEHDEGGHGEGGEAHGKAAEGAHGGGAHGDKKDGHAADAGKFGKIVALEEFTVNLATTGSVSPKYARVNISIEVPSTDVEAEVNHKVPQIRNTIIDLFNAKRPADLATGEGRTHLKDEIKSALNTFMVTGKIKGVFFTSFAVSS